MRFLHYLLFFFFAGYVHFLLRGFDVKKPARCVVACALSIATIHLLGWGAIPCGISGAVYGEMLFSYSLCFRR